MKRGRRICYCRKSTARIADDVAAQRDNPNSQRLLVFTVGQDRLRWRTGRCVYRRIRPSYFLAGDLFLSGVRPWWNCEGICWVASTDARGIQQEILIASLRDADDWIVNNRTLKRPATIRPAATQRRDPTCCGPIWNSRTAQVYAISAAL